MSAGINVQQAALCVLSDLNKVCTEEIVDTLLSYSEGTTLSAYKTVFEHARDFKKSTGTYPGKEYLYEKFPSTCRFGEFVMSPTSDMLLILIAETKKEYLIYQASSFISEGKIENLDEIVSEYKSSKIKKVDYGFSSVADTYVSRKIVGPGVKFGVVDIDECAHGLGYGTLTTLAGGAGSGKTTMARSFAYNVAYNEGKNVVFISMEISRDDMKAQFLARHSKALGSPISGRDIIKCMCESEYRDGMSERAKDKVRNEVEKTRKKLKAIADDFEMTSKGKIFVVEESDFPDWSFSGFRSYLEKLDDEIKEMTGKGIDVVILDYIQLVKPVGTKLSFDLKDYRNLFIQNFRSMCVSFNGRQLIGVILSQVNRQGMQKQDAKAKSSDGMRASYQDLAELNSIERESSLIVVIYSNVETRARNQLYAQVIKNRLGNSMEQMAPINADFRCNAVGNNLSIRADIINESALDSDILGGELEDIGSIFDQQ